MKRCCCNLFDPALNHSADESASLQLRDLAKRLKSDPTAGDFIFEIFSPKSISSYFCPVSVGLKRTCITLLNWIPALGSEAVRAVGVGLVTHVARTEPRLSSVFVIESLEVIRLLRDSLLVSGEKQIEIFPRFVAATRRVLSGGGASEDSARRGLLLALVGAGNTVTAIRTLVAIVCAVAVKHPHLVAGPGVTAKMGMAILSIAGEAELRPAALLLLERIKSQPEEEKDTNFEIFHQLSIEFPLDLLAEALSGEDTQRPLTAGTITIQSMDFLCLRLQRDLDTVRSHEGPVSAESVLRQLTRFDSGLLPALQTVAVSAVSRRLTTDSTTTLAQLVILGFGDRVFSRILTNRAVVGRAVSFLVGKSDLPSLQSLGRKLGYSAPAELVVGYLEFALSVHIMQQLQDNSNGIPAVSVGRFLTESIFDSKYSIAELIDSNGAETVVYVVMLLASLWQQSRWDQQVVLAKRVIALVSSVSIAAASGQPKRLKANASENLTGTFMNDNILHMIQLIEDSGGDALGLLIDSAGHGIVRTFAVRVSETIVKLDSPGHAWARFAAAVKGDDSVLLPVLPVVVEGLMTHGRGNLAQELLEVKSVPRGIARLLRGFDGGAGGVQEPISGLESELRQDRTVSVKLSLLRAASAFRPTHSLPTTTLLTDVCELVSRNMNDDQVVAVVGDFLSVFGPYIVSPEIANTPRPSGGALSDFEATTFTVSVVNQFLLPSVKQASHAFAIQELLAVMGGASFVSSAFSAETKLLLTPYLTSTYRASGSLEYDAKLATIQDVFLWLCSMLPVRRELFVGLRVAVAKDSGLCVWVLPFLVELLATNLTSDETEAVATKLVSVFASLATSATECNITAVFGIIDRLKSRVQGKKLSSRELKFIAAVTDDSGCDEIFAKAAIAVHDFPRALWYQERLLVGVGGQSAEGVLRLGEVFSQLGDTAGVIGACSLIGDADERINAMRREVTGRSHESLLALEADAQTTSLKDYIRLLVENGHYRSAVAWAPSRPQAGEDLSDKLAEASWRLSRWDLHPAKPASGTFNEAFCVIGASTPDNEKIVKIAKSNLVRKLALNLRLEDLSKLFCLGPNLPAPEHMRSIPGECREVILECSAAIATGSNRTAFLTQLLRHFRKSGSVVKMKRLLPRLTGCGDALVEWAKASWAVGDRISAYRALERAPTGQVLRLKYAADLEVLIPKLMIAQYRDLLAKAATDADKRAAASGFAEYLDGIPDSASWNKQELVKEISINFFDSVRFAPDGKQVMFALNRLFQLHWELSHSGDAIQMKCASEVVKVFVVGWKFVPVRVWFLSLSQLLVRLGSADFGPVCHDIIVAVLAEYPRQACWVIVPSLLNSRSPDRRAAGVKIIQQAVEKATYPNMQQLVTVIRLVGESLVAVARADNIKTLSESKEGSRLLRSTGGLLVVPVQAQISGIPETEVRVAKFTDHVHTYNTKAKPKRISIVDSGGRCVEFILKLEKKTDLRKDSRMMDFVNVVNNEVGKRKKNAATHLVGLRTYSVLTLSEDTALIEFIPNLVTMRKIIDENLQRIGKSVSLYLNKEVMAKLASKTDGFNYFTSVVDTIPPMIAEWLGREFGSHPKNWLAARSMFTKSQAGWSIVGHIVGLGDRHPDNILIDTLSGEVVHVDFDCIFSRGMVLNIPELVPFRLTKICVSAMGVCGVEGPYRSCCEEMMRLTRDKKKMLLAVLHAFIADPLIDWQGTGAKKAKDVIGAVEKKLNGYVDVGEMRNTPDMDEKLIVFNEAAEKNTGLGKDRGAALSVEGQVDELIRAAVCQRNLAKMYLGWMPLF